MDHRENHLIELLKKAVEVADRHHDGHITFLKFTTGWKVSFGTPDLDTGYGRKEIRDLKAFDSLQEALEGLL